MESPLQIEFPVWAGCVSGLVDVDGTTSMRAGVDGCGLPSMSPSGVQQESGGPRVAHELVGQDSLQFSHEVGVGVSLINDDTSSQCNGVCTHPFGGGGGVNNCGVHHTMEASLQGTN